MDGQEYRQVARSAWLRSGWGTDPDVARNYRSLAGAYLALARFCERSDGDYPLLDEAEERAEQTDA